MIGRHLLALVALTILLAGTPRADAGQATQAAPQTPVAALGVDLLMKEPEKHPGTLVVEGVVKTAAVAGCYMLGCCGSPMLAVYLSFLGAAFLPWAKPFVALLTTVVLITAWLFSIRCSRVVTRAR